MKKVSIFLLSLFFFIYPVYAEEFSITGENVILYNMNDDKELYSKNADEIVEIASLTKMMTALVTIENTSDLTKEITITEKDFEGTTGYSKAGFKVGDKVTYEDLLYGILLPSGADAVNAAVNNTLGYEKFISKMNETTKKIGLNNTKFSNPIGKDDENNYSTASDIAKLLKYSLKNETFKRVFTTKSYKTTNGLNLKSTISNYDNILQTNKIDGAKSGFTKEAGRCLASITNLHDVNYLLVVIKSSTEYPYNAVKDTINIYNYYDENYSYQSILDDDTFIKEIPIKLSNNKSYKITGSENISLYLKNDTKVNYVYEGVDEISYKTKKGAILGTIKIYEGEKLLETSIVYLEENIKYYPLELCLIILITLIILIIFILKNKKRKRRRRRK